MRSSSESALQTPLSKDMGNFRMSSAPSIMLGDGDDIEIGDSVLSASQLRKRYHYGGDKTDAELTASQLRSRYELYGRSSMDATNWEYNRHQRSPSNSSASSGGDDFFTTSSQFDGGFDREIANTVCRSIHLNGAREKRLKRSRYLRLCSTVCLGLVVLFGLFIYSGYPSEYNEVDGVISRRSHSERIRHVFATAATHVTTHVGQLKGGRPAPLQHHSHHGPVWKRPCGNTLCMGDRVTINIVDMLLGEGVDKGRKGFEAASVVQVKAMLKAKALKHQEDTQEENGQRPIGNIMCTATVMLVDNDQYLDSLVQGELQPLAEEEPIGERLVKVRFDGWAGQSGFWIKEKDTSVVTPQANRVRNFRGGNPEVIEIPLSPCPFSFATSGVDSVSISLTAPCSVAMREHCELDTDNIDSDRGNNSDTSSNRKGKEKKKRRASGCTVLQNRGVDSPELWQSAQEWGFTSGVCPPSDTVAWAPDQWSHPDCSHGMKRLFKLDDKVLGDEWKTWKKTQKLLAEEGYCPDPDAYLWLPDTITHPACSKCIKKQCDSSLSSSRTIRAETNHSSEVAVGCGEMHFQAALHGDISMVHVFEALYEAQDTCAQSGGGDTVGSNTEQGLWEASGILSGQCPSTQLVQWSPDRKVAYPNCSSSIQAHCQVIQEEERQTARLGRPMRMEAMSAFSACSGSWTSRKDLATLIQAQDLARSHCPAHSAQDLRSPIAGGPGFVWGVHEKQIARNSLSSRYCEL